MLQPDPNFETKPKHTEEAFNRGIMVTDGPVDPVIIAPQIAQWAQPTNETKVKELFANWQTQVQQKQMEILQGAIENNAVILAKPVELKVSSISRDGTLTVTFNQKL